MLNDVLDKKETAEFLRMSVSNIDRLIHNKQIPHSKVGKKVLFLREDLIRWLKNKRVVGPEGEKKEKKIEGWLGHEE